jgi:serine protease Do
MRHPVRLTLLSVLLVFCGLAAGLVLTGRMRSSDVSEARPAQAPPAVTQRAAAVPSVTGALPDFTGVAAQTVNAVTNISSLQVVQRRDSPFANDPFFQYFFEGDMLGEQNRRELSLGSGVVVSPDGYVLTNNHVIGRQQRGTQVSVTLADKREIRAQVVGADDATDIALVKVSAEGLRAIPWGDSSRLKVAEWVLAIGNPFQLNQTVTLGIISALGRANIGAAAYEDFIQTDAAINPGNSGGALVNSRGELIGINTAIYSQSGGYQGVGFAVPSNLARRVMDDLIKYGEVRRASIGHLEAIPLTTQLVQQLGVTTTRGAVVWRMSRNSEAYRVGIRPGDVIVSFNGTPVEDPGHFLRLLADSRIGSTATIGLLRGAEKLEVRVQLQPPPERRRRGV